MLPAVVHHRVLEAPLEVSPQAPFSDREVKEYKRIARVVSQAPWSLSKAAAYLEGLVDPSVPAGAPPHLCFLFSYKALKPMAFAA
eukprot:3530351-Alexandrium_andersonii.AAC.1